MLCLEFAAVQIIAVDIVQNSSLRKAGYLIKAGHFAQNIVSTGDLNRGRRDCPACFLCYFLHAAKSNIPSPLQGVPRFCKPRISALQRRFHWGQIKSLLLSQQSSAASRLFPAAEPPYRYAHDARKNTPYGGVPWIKTRKSCKRSA